jgi:hypothetical protein
VEQVKESVFIYAITLIACLVNNGIFVRRACPDHMLDKHVVLDSCLSILSGPNIIRLQVLSPISSRHLIMTYTKSKL